MKWAAYSLYLFGGCHFSACLPGCCSHSLCGASLHLVLGLDDCSLLLLVIFPSELNFSDCFQKRGRPQKSPLFLGPLLCPPPSPCDASPGDVSSAWGFVLEGGRVLWVQTLLPHRHPPLSPPPPCGWEPARPHLPVTPALSWHPHWPASTCW